jgi:hypothetical protein
VSLLLPLLLVRLLPLLLTLLPLLLLLPPPPLPLQAALHRPLFLRCNAFVKLEKQNPSSASGSVRLEQKHLQSKPEQKHW